MSHDAHEIDPNRDEGLDEEEDDDEHPRHSVPPEDTLADPYIPPNAA